MDQKTTVYQLKEKVRKFCDERDWDRHHNAKDLAIGIITEAGELLEIFRFWSREKVEKMFEDKKKKEEITGELIDVLWFVLRLSQKYNIDLSEGLEKSIKKNTKRFPVEKR